jgi:hypothetical protein
MREKPPPAPPKVLLIDAHEVSSRKRAEEVPIAGRRYAL